MPYPYHDQEAECFIYAKAFARNIGSIRVLQKAGFQQEGLSRKDEIKEGEMLDVALFAMLKD